MPDDKDDAAEQRAEFGHIDEQDMQILNDLRQKKCESDALIPVSFIGIEDAQVRRAKPDNSNGSNGRGGANNASAGAGTTARPDTITGSPKAGSSGKRKKSIHSLPKPPAKKAGEDPFGDGQVNGARAFWTY